MKIFDRDDVTRMCKFSNPAYEYQRQYVKVINIQSGGKPPIPLLDANDIQKDKPKPRLRRYILTKN